MSSTMSPKPSNVIPGHNPDQGALDLGSALHPVQFRETLAERALQRHYQEKFGRHGEGHAEHMYEKNLEWRHDQGMTR